MVKVVAELWNKFMIYQSFWRVNPAIHIANQVFSQFHEQSILNQSRKSQKTLSQVAGQVHEKLKLSRKQLLYLSFLSPEPRKDFCRCWLASPPKD